MRYSAFSLFKQGLSGNRGWTQAWRKAEPKPAYDAIIIGGGHGLATAYYLAKQHGITNVAVLKKAVSLGQYRAQHHDHPLQLSPARQLCVL